MEDENVSFCYKMTPVKCRCASECWICKRQL